MNNVANQNGKVLEETVAGSNLQFLYIYIYIYIYILINWWEK